MTAGGGAVRLVAMTYEEEIDVETRMRAQKDTTPLDAWAELSAAVGSKALRLMYTEPYARQVLITRTADEDGATFVIETYEEPVETSGVRRGPFRWLGEKLGLL